MICEITGASTGDAPVIGLRREFMLDSDASQYELRAPTWLPSGGARGGVMQNGEPAAYSFVRRPE